MSARVRGRMVLTAWAFLAVAEASAQTSPRVDALGDPLPHGAVARLGTERFATRNVPTSLSFTFDGALLAAADYSDAYLWDASTGKRLLYLPGGGGRVALSPDGKWLATGNRSVIPGRPMRLWNVQTGKAVDFDCPKDASAFGFSPDGKTLAVACEKSMDLMIYDVPTWKLQRHLKGPEAANCHDLAFSQDGRKVAVGHTSARQNRSVGVASVWDLDKKERREFLATHIDVKHLAFTLEQEVLFAMSEGRAHGWHLDTGKTTPWTGEFWQGGLAFDTAGKVLAVPRQLSLVDFASKRLIVALGKENESANNLVLSGNGKKLAVVDGRGQQTPPVVVWDIDARKPGARADGHTGPVNSLAFSSDGKRIATGSNGDGTFAIWDAASAKRLSATPFKDAKAKPNVQWLGPRHASFVDEGKSLFLSGQHWDLTTKEPKRRPPPGDAPVELLGATGARLSPNGKWGVSFVPDLARSADLPRHQTVFWEVAPTKIRLRLDAANKEKGDQVDEYLYFWTFANTAPLACIHRRCTNGPVTIIKEKNRLEVWDVANQKRIHSLARGDENLRAVAFAPDDRALAVFASYPPRLEMVELRYERARWRKTWEEDDFNHTWRDCAFAPHGQWIAAMSGARSVQLLETWTGDVIATFGGHLRPINALAFAPDGRTFASASDDTTALLWSAMPPALPLPERWKDDDHLWQELSAGTPAAYRIIGPLIANPERALALFEKRLIPAPAIDQQAIQKDLKRLASDVFVEREAAMKRLRSLGRHTLPALQETLKKAPPLEVKRRLDELSEALDLRPAADELRTLRAILVLELIGSDEAGVLLRRMTKGDAEAEATQQAHAALARVR